MKILINEKISPHRYKDNHGYLICTDCIMARTGKQTYTRDECFGDGDNTEIEVDRPSKEVFDAKTMASFENVPITIEHPSVNVDPDNYNTLSVGHMRDIRKGTYEDQPVMVGTAVITDSEAIEKVESGNLTNLSCGYDCDIDDSDNPHQFNIRGNHIALCECPRAGITHIQDSKAIKDMALSRGDAIDVCMSLGKKFIEHFHNIYSDSTNEAVNHWACEMESWFSNVKDIILRSKKRKITSTQLIDWFFTAGAYFKYFINDCSDDEEKSYDEFIHLVLEYNNVRQAVNDMFGKKTVKDEKKQYEVTIESEDKTRIKDDEDWQTIYVKLVGGKVLPYEYDANEETENEVINEIIDSLGEDGENVLVAIYSTMTNNGLYGELYRAKTYSRDSKRHTRDAWSGSYNGGFWRVDGNRITITRKDGKWFTISVDLIKNRQDIYDYIDGIKRPDRSIKLRDDNHIQGVDEDLFYEIVDNYPVVRTDEKLQAIVRRYHVNAKTARQLASFYGLDYSGFRDSKRF